jgi:hypothetical protein
VEPGDKGETELTITHLVVTNPSEIRELTIDELDQAGGGIFPPGPTAVDAGIFHATGVIIQD